MCSFPLLLVPVCVHSSDWNEKPEIEKTKTTTATTTTTTTISNLFSQETLNVFVLSENKDRDETKQQSKTNKNNNIVEWKQTKKTNLFEINFEQVR